MDMYQKRKMRKEKQSEPKKTDINKVSINWYPGHMARAKRLLKDQVNRVDLVIELCDARLPLSSRNPDLLELTKEKSRLLILGKSDLADKAQTAKWLSYFRKQGIFCVALDVTKQAKQASQLIEKVAAETVERAAQRGIKKTVRAMVVGVPNVGKSTFINRLHQSPIAKTGDKPGVTRSNQWVKITPYLELMDSPGMLWPKLDDQAAAIRLSYIAAIKDEIQDVRMLAITLLEDLLKTKEGKEAVITRLKLKDESLRGEELLHAVCRGRGFIMRGNVVDEERGCAVVLDEFRAGKLGKITLEQVPAREVSAEETTNPKSENALKTATDEFQP